MFFLKRRKRNEPHKRGKIPESAVLYRKEGFTILELLVVTTIIGILAAVGVSSYGRFVSTAKADEAISMTQALVGYAQSFIRAHPTDWSQNGQLLGENATGTSLLGDGDWVEEVIVASDPKYFYFSYDAAATQLRIWGKSEPFDTETDFSLNADTMTITFSGNGETFNWQGTGKLQEIVPSRP